jgi:hypothetical protein
MKLNAPRSDLQLARHSRVRVSIGIRRPLALCRRT